MSESTGENMRSEERSRRRRLAMIFITAVIVAFFAGYAIGARRSDERSYDSARQQMLEFIRLGTKLGFLSVDRQKLDEMVITMSESEWEDRDALDRAKGGNP